MNDYTISQAYLFLIFVLNGVLIGLLFDFFRILRKSFKTPDFITYIEDIVFWFLTGLIILYSIFTYNNGELRAYIFIAIFIGIVIYILALSKYIIKINVKIINFIKLITSKIINILMFPLKKILKLLKKVYLKPIRFIYINVHKNMTNILKNIQIKIDFGKKATKKEG